MPHVYHSQFHLFPCLGMFGQEVARVGCSFDLPELDQASLNCALDVKFTHLYAPQLGARPICLLARMAVEESE